jgi:hypothetical protein
MKEESGAGRLTGLSPRLSEGGRLQESVSEPTVAVAVLVTKPVAMIFTVSEISWWRLPAAR